MPCHACTHAFMHVCISASPPLPLHASRNRQQALIGTSCSKSWERPSCATTRVLSRPRRGGAAIAMATFPLLSMDTLVPPPCSADGCATFWMDPPHPFDSGTWKHAVDHATGCSMHQTIHACCRWRGKLQRADLGCPAATTTRRANHEGQTASPGYTIRQAMHGRHA